MKISAVIITFNEEQNIAEAVASVKWADEILVVDSFSEDRTIEIAESSGAKVVTREWKGFADQKQFAADAAVNDWIISLDADERISPKLAKEIQDLNRAGNLEAVDGYLIPRLSIYMGHEIRHSGWYPDRQLRLFDRRMGKWRPRIVHESIEMSPGRGTGKLAGNILHYSIRNASEHSKLVTERYAPLSARQMLADGRKTTKTKAGVAGIAAFLRSYVLKGGVLDGFPGLCIAYFAAYNAFLKHLLLLELQQASSER